VKEWEAYVRYLSEDIEAKEGQEIKLIIRDREIYMQRPVVAKIYHSWRKGLDKLWIMDPLGRLCKEDPWGMEIIKVEDEELLLDSSYQKCAPKF
jgi:hypothetical protein